MDVKFCACGCGKKIIEFDGRGRQHFYIHGHNFKGKHHTEKAKKGQSDAKMGDKNPSKRPEVRKKIGVTLQGNKNRVGTHASLETRKKQRDAKVGTHQSLEHCKNGGISRTGDKNPNWHKHFTKEEIDGKMVGLLKYFKNGGKHGMTGKQHTKEAKKKCGDAQRGDKSYRWKGGITPLHEKIRASSQYACWHQQVRINYNFTCKDCSQHGGILRVHHIKPFAVLLDEAIKSLPLLDPYEAAMIYTPLWDISNGVVLCEECHKIRHKKKKGSIK